MKFNINNDVWQFITLCVRYLALNLVFLVTCIPLITIGPARTALYSTVFAYCDHDDINLTKEYLRRFQKEFLPSLTAWLIMVVVDGAILFALVFYNALDTNSAYGTLPILLIAACVITITCEFWFPLQARYTNTFWGTWRNALTLPWAMFGHTLCLLAINIAATAAFVYSIWMRTAFILLGFAWLAYAKALIYLRIFARISNPHTPVHDPHEYSLPSASLQ